MTEEEPQGYIPVMPFVCCITNGGTYDDHAFVAGVRYGEHAWRLRTEKGAEYAAYVEPAMVGQYDLLAMDEGYTMTAEPWDEHPDEWVLVTLRRAHNDVPPDLAAGSGSESWRTPGGEQ